MSELRQEIERLRAEIDAADDWANGIFQMLVQVLPLLVRDHPNVTKIQHLLEASDARYEELLAHPERAEEGEPAGLHEAGKMMYRQMAALGVWPDIDPAEFARQSLARARPQRGG
jgi:hypothetical protein